jgi:hypothetical protein
MSKSRWDSGVDVSGFLSDPIESVTIGNIVFNPTPAADLTANGIVISATVDVNAVGVGALLFLAADGHYETSDANDSAKMPVTAMALETGTGTKNVLLMGFFLDNSFTWTKGAILYVDPAVGLMAESAPAVSGDQVQVVGIAYSDLIVHFNPDLTIIEVA